LPRPGAEAIERGGFESLVPGDAATLESGLQKLAEDRFQEITPSEIFGLEAIVLPRNRPVAFVRGESYDDLEEPWVNLNDDVVKRRIASLLPLIGRVEVPSSPILPYAGTGFVVGRGLIATNRHVAQLFSQGLGLTIRYRAGDAVIDFKRQIDAPDDDRAAYLSVRAVEMIHPYWDMALLRVDNLPTDRMLRLSVKSPEELLDHKVVVIGYPARDDRSDLALQDRVFNRTYGVKRLQPGFIRARAEIQSFENNVNAMTHDASTLGSNSGAAVIDINSGDVVALHFAGEYLKANYAVPMYELARDSRVAPLLNFEGTLPPTNDWAPAWRSTEWKDSADAAASPQPSSAGEKVEASATADIFISYAREDEQRAEMLAQRLGDSGWSIFWDRTIPIGKTWRETIGRELQGARCVIVLWSKNSIESRWVQEEADDAQERGILVPILIENVRAPIGFRSFQAAHLENWDGTEPNETFHRLITDIAALIRWPRSRERRP
jgi:S1-C subfamily serine protease